jgi:hypothetical protein
VSSGEVTTGLEYWRAALAISASEPAAVERLLADPNFDRALRHSVTESLTFFDANPAFYQHFLDQGSFFAGLLALYLHASGALTHRRLAALCGTSRLLSNGRASAILLNLWSKGFVRRAETRGADRTVRYTPTPRMLTAYRARLKIEVESAAWIAPELAALLARWEEPGVFEQYMAVTGAYLAPLMATPHPALTALEIVGNYRAGFHVLFALIDGANRGGPFPACGESGLSVSALANRFRVARSHVRRILDTCSASGLLTRGAGDGTITLLPALHDVFRHYYAVVYLGVLADSHDTLARLPHQATAQLPEAGERTPDRSAPAGAELL